MGEPGENLVYCWTDPDPIESIRFAGAHLSACSLCAVAVQAMAVCDPAARPWRFAALRSTFMSEGSRSSLPAGLSAWDKHVGYRNLRMHPVLHPPPSSPPPKQERAAQPAWPPSEPGRSQLTAAGPAAVTAQQAQQASSVPSLLHCCQAMLGRSLAPGSVCDVLQVADCLDPVVDGLRRWAVGC